MPGGYSCISMKAAPPPDEQPVILVPVQVGALLSLSGVQAACGYEFGSHIAIENHGATLNSNQWATSEPGVWTVGAPAGSRGSVSFQVTLSPEPRVLDRNVMSGSSCPM